MDRKRFDALTKRLSIVGSRRRLLVGGAVAGLLAGIGPAATAVREVGAQATCISLNKRCNRNRQCCSRRCKRGRCRQGPGTCRSGQDFCAGTSPRPCSADPDCHCFPTTGGVTRCARFAPGTSCGQCTSDATCVAIYGAGAFCGTDTGFTCSCIEGARFCAVPCPQ